MKNATPHQIGICSIFRDEAPYLREWILFHQKQGFTKFLLFNDRSIDNYLEVLDPFLKSGLVELRDAEMLEGETNLQKSCNTQGLALSRGVLNWLALIDIDEFIFSPKDLIVDCLPKDLEIAAVGVYWKVFGSSSHMFPPAGGVIRNYIRCARFSGNPLAVFWQEVFRLVLRPIIGTVSGRVFQKKCIVRPDSVFRASGHGPTDYIGKFVDENGRSFKFPFWRSNRKLRINHYWSRSQSELVEKAFKRIDMFGSDHRERNQLRHWLNYESLLNSQVDREILEKIPDTWLDES